MSNKLFAGGSAEERMLVAAGQLKRAERVLVLGSAGSGKSALTVELCRLLDLEPIHLDAQFWQAGWERTPADAWAVRVGQLIQRPRWMMDGTYESTLRLRLPRADTVIILEDSRIACLYRVLKRKFTVDDLNRPDAPPGQKIDRAFLKYIWQYPSVTRPYVYRCIADCEHRQQIIVLRGLTDISRLLRQVREQTR